MHNKVQNLEIYFSSVLNGGIEKIFDPQMASSIERQQTMIGSVLVTPGQRIYK